MVQYYAGNLDRYLFDLDLLCVYMCMHLLRTTAIDLHPAREKLACVRGILSSSYMTKLLLKYFNLVHQYSKF